MKSAAARLTPSTNASAVTPSAAAPEQQAPLVQWFALYDAPLGVDSSAEASLPMPAKVFY
jgi:hypothetical protein